MKKRADVMTDNQWGMIKIAAALGLVVCFLLWCEPIQADAAPVSRERQDFLATDYRFRISRTADASEREALYLRMMEECPDAELTEESYWALSNLYLDDFDNPREDKAREVLELFLRRYPSSRWTSHVESRLRWLRGEASAP